LVDKKAQARKTGFGLRGLFDIERGAVIEGEPIAAAAQFTPLGTVRAVKSAKLWSAEMNEYATSSA
jgi:hypothetical protein